MCVRILLTLSLAFSAMGVVNGGSPAERPVSQDWMLRAQQAVGKGVPVEDLVREFARSHHDPEAFPAKSSEWTEPYLNLVPVDLDGDGVQEQVLFISGAYKDQTRVYVLKRRHDNWQIVYTHQAWAHNEPPPYDVLECGGGRHAVRFVHMEAHGTGIWQYTNLFLRAVDGDVVCGLESVEEHNLALLGYNLNGNAHASKVTVHGDDLHVTYAYEFYAGFSLVEKLKVDAGNAKDGDLLVKGTAEVTYRWEPMARKYKVVSSPLSESQIRCFTHLDDERLFGRAYRRELETLAKDGTPAQQSLARYFLRMISRETR
ncbi:MAG: hypothetical protein H6Q00_389 [Holophagaceae bacterium]|nr:hypothetical protein [Holophagaceae bacterium]